MTSVNNGNGSNGNGNSNSGNGNSSGNSTGNGNATNAEANNSQNQSGILFPIASETSDTESYFIGLIKTSGKEKNYELIEYINDVNREYAEVLVEQNINGALDTAYVYGAAIGTGSDRLSLDRFDGSTGYYLYDPRGSVTGLTNEEGQIYQSYCYSVFGEITFGAPQYENEYTYNGESYNPNIKSQYLRARYYCVVTADFLTEDSYLGRITEPLTLNRYNYCVGNPLNYVDPSGNVAVKSLWDILFGGSDGDEPIEIKGYPIPSTPTPSPTSTPKPRPTQVPLSLPEGVESYEQGILPQGGISYIFEALKRQFSDGYLNQQVENAQEIKKIYDCEIVDFSYNIIDDNFHMSREGVIALMYWETVNTYSLEKGYLEFTKRSDTDSGTFTIREITDWEELKIIIQQANEGGEKVYLSGVKPHEVGDHSTTSGFGDYLVESDMSYYESKGYIMKKLDIKVNGKIKSFVYFDASEEDDGEINDVGYIPINIVVEKYLDDIRGMEDSMRKNLRKELGNEAVLYYTQREYDALMIARYNTGSLGAEGQDLIISNTRNPEDWKRVFINAGISTNRTDWMVNTIMFGGGEYIESGKYVTPLYGVHVEGITNEW